MQLATFLRVGVIAAASLSLISCMKMEIEDHSYQFNEATGSLGLRLLLLNAVRASKDYPLQFSKLQSYQGTGQLGGSLTATIPWGSAASLNSKVDWKNGISQLALVDLNTEEAQQALKKDVSLETFRYYWLQRGRRSMSVINAALVESVTIHTLLYDPFVEIVKAIHADAKAAPGGVAEVCSSVADYFSLAASKTPMILTPTQRGSLAYICRTLIRLYEKCEAAFQPDRIFVNGAPARWVRTSLDTECQSKQLAALGLLFVVTGFDVDTAKKGAPSETDHEADARRRNEQSERCKPSPVDRYGIRRTVEFFYGMKLSNLRAKLLHLQKLLDDATERGKPGERHKPRQGLQDGVAPPRNGMARGVPGTIININQNEKKESQDITRKYIFSFSLPIANRIACAIHAQGQDVVRINFRSPERMVRYLGELIAAQNYPKSRFIPKTYDVDAQQEVVLLRVVRGPEFSGEAAVSVRDPDGEVFYVPKPDYGDRGRERSLELLSLVSDLLNGAVSKKAVPQVTTFTLTPQ